MTDNEYTMMDKENRDLLIELRTQNIEILRRLNEYDKIVVSRAEYQATITELRANHTRNQANIEQIEDQLRSIIWKVGGGLATLQVITSLVLFLLSKGV